MRQFLGYFLGFSIFIAGIPSLMWWVSGLPSLNEIPMARLCLAIVLVMAGLALSIWSIVYMKRVGKGNPFDAMGHEVAPRTRNLMTEGPYKRSRNPMLSGTYLYYLGVLTALWNWKALLQQEYGFRKQRPSTEHRDFPTEYPHCGSSEANP